jgi:hypothetical protein
MLSPALLAVIVVLCALAETAIAAAAINIAIFFIVIKLVKVKN